MSDDELEEGEIDEFGRHPRPPLPRAGADSRLDLEQDEGFPHLDHVEEPPSLGETLAGKSWGDLISLLQNDPAGINLHTGLTFDEVAKELEARLQSLAAEGDSLMLYIRRMAATVKKMPMAPVLCLLMSAVNMTLRLRRYNISTSVDGEKSVPFRGEVKARGGAAEEDEDDMTASQQAAQVAMAIPISLDTLQIKAAPRGSAAPAQTLNTTPHVPRSARPASHGGGDNSSESGKSSTSTESSKVKTQLSTREQDQLAMDQLCIMLPMLHSEGGQPNTHEVTVAMMSRYDGEYHLQNKFKAKSDANKVFAAAAGKGTEHMLRKACTVQVLKNGVGLMNLLVGSHHIPLADADGNPLFLKHLIKTSVERRDLKLGIHFLAGDQDGAGLVPTIDTNTMRISNLLAASGLKTSYVAVKMSGAAGSQDGPATPEQLAEGLEAPVPLHPEVPRVPQTPLISTMASILGSTFFFSTPAENDPKHKPFFAEAARALEAKGLGYVFIDQTIYGPSNSGAAASLGLLADGAISRTGGKMSYFVKQLSYTSHRSELAECGLSLSINYDSLLYAGDKAKRPEKEKILRLMSIMCSLACEAARRDVLTSPGVFRDAVIQVFPFAGGSLSAISAAANKADGNPTLKKQSAALEEFIANKESLLFVHKALLQLAIYAKKKHNPTEFQDVLMLADLERMIPATPPRAGESAPKKKREDV